MPKLPDVLQTWPDIPASTTMRVEPTLLLAQANGIALPLPGHSVHTVVFSPPYWALRRYKGDTQTFVWPGLTYRMPGGDIILPGNEGCDHEWGEVVVPVRQGKVGDKSTPGGGQKHQAAARLLTPARDNRNGLGTSSLGTTDRFTENLRDTARGGNPQTTAFCTKCGAVRCALGLEPDPDMFIGHLLLILREVRRVLRPDGTLWLNLGFSYAASKGAGVYRSKDMVPIPWLLAIAAQYDGWYLRSPIVWSKGNAMPSSVTDRPSQDWEQVLLLSPSARYYYDREPLREPLQGQYAQRRLTPRSEHPKFAGQPQHRRPNYEMRDKPAPEGHPNGRNKRATWDAVTETARLVEDMVTAGYDLVSALRWAMGESTGDVVSESDALWRINTQPYKGAHYATYPVALPAGGVPAWMARAGSAKCGKPYRRVVERSIATNQAGDDPTMDTGRAGFDRQRGGEADRRLLTVPQAEIAEYLKTAANGRAGECRARYGGKWEHWLRTDDSGARLPRPENWVDLKEFLELDDRFDADLLPYGGKQLELMRLNNEFNLSRRGRASTEIRDEFMNRRPLENLGWRPDCRCFDHAFTAPVDADPNEPHPVCATCGETHAMPATVLDVTVGSGTTLQAAHLLGRKGIGFDLAGEYLAGHAQARVLQPADLYAPPEIPAVNWQMALPENEAIPGDCGNVLPRLPRASVDLVLLDPPFNLSKKYGKGVDDSRTEAEYAELLRWWLELSAPLLKSTGHLVLYHTPQYALRAGQWLAELGLHFRGWVTRQAEGGNGIIKPGAFGPEHYAFVWFSRAEQGFTYNKIRLPHRRCARCGDYATHWGGKEKHRTEAGKYAPDVWTDLPIPRGKAKSRAANELPLETMLRWMLALTHPGDYVFDPFLGSGTTAAAGELAGRRWGGVELVADNQPVIRLKQLTARGAAAHWTDEMPAQQRYDLALALMRLGGEFRQPEAVSDETLFEAGKQLKIKNEELTIKKLHSSFPAPARGSLFKKEANQ